MVGDAPLPYVVHNSVGTTVGVSWMRLVGLLEQVQICFKVTGCMRHMLQVAIRTRRNGRGDRDPEQFLASSS